MNLKVRHLMYKYLPPVPTLSRFNPVHAPPSHFLKICLNIILPSMCGSSKWSLCLRFHHQNPVYTTSSLPHTCYMPCLSHSSRCHHLNNISEEYRSLSCSCGYILINYIYVFTLFIAYILCSI